ncbi:MAG TPA: YwqG family protein [Phycisphaerae bacterium]|nr:YwqG family protein [Phycisphaerae bacterium]
MPESILLVVAVAAVVLVLLMAARFRERRRDRAAAEGESESPRTADINVDWTNRQSLCDLLARHFAPETAEAVSRTILPSIRILPAPPPYEGFPLGRSRIGGEPDMPPGHPWPRRQGRPLSFLAQINCAELPDPDGASPLPRDGLLLVFYDADQQPWGFDPADRDGWKVIYHEGDPARLTRTPAPEELGEEARFQPAKVRFRAEFTLPPAECLAVDALSLGSDATDRLLMLRTDVEEADTDPAARLLGHPDPIQSGQMQLDCQLASHGLYCGDPTGYEDPRAAELAKGAGEWMLLLQLDTRDDMVWGDMGRLYIHIRADDLLLRRFDDVWLILQCS